MSSGRAAGGAASRVWERLRALFSKEQLVGADANGNRYYKWMEPHMSGTPVERRRVVVPGNNLLYDPRTVPPEWRAWLAKTRAEPPTEEEMAATAARAAVMRERIRAIEEREQQRRFRMESLGKQATAAGGPDINRFTEQLESKGFGVGGGGSGGNSGGGSGGGSGSGAAAGSSASAS